MDNYIRTDQEELLFIMKVVAQIPIGGSANNGFIEITRNTEENFDLKIIDDRFTKAKEVESDLFG